MALYNELLDQAKSFGLSHDEASLFFEKLGRKPSKEELAVCGSLWSEHCSYKSSRVHLKRFHTEEPWVLQGPGENAGVVAISKNYGIAFKMESHNHPSYLEPYQGAATGVGGILRDVFCMGAMPIANLNCLRYGEGTWNSHLLRYTVSGIGDYGNSVGVPTVGGDTSFHHGFSKNILVNAFCAGLIHKDKIYKGILSEEGSSVQEVNSQKDFTKIIFPNEHLKNNSELKSVLFPENENILIYFGSATGRDGVHGATMSSDEFSGTGQALKPTVQVGDPFAEKCLLEATLALIEQKLTVGLQDMGAAGLTSSSVEMAGRSGCGVVLDLNKVPQRAKNMQAWEILLSESQERMLCAVEPSKVQEVLNLLNKFSLSSAIIGKVNRTALFTCLFDDIVVTATPVSILVDETPKNNFPLETRENYLKEHATIINRHNDLVGVKSGLNLFGKNKEAHEEILKKTSLENLVEKFPNLISDLFSHPSFASRKPLFDQYCSTVQGNTVAACGTFQGAAAAVVRLPKFAQDTINNKVTNIGLAVAGGCEERWVELNPEQGASLSVLKIARKIIASNGIPLAMTDCLNFGSPKSPLVMRQLSDAIDGINIVAKELHIPIVSGNVSLNNQTEGKPIPPTPMIGMVGKVDDVSRVPFNIVPKKIWENENTLFLVHVSHEHSIMNSSYEASQVAWVLGQSNRHCPQVNLKNEKSLWNHVQYIISHHQPLLCFPIGHGGLLGSLISCALNSSAQLNIENSLWKMESANLFSEGNRGYVFGVTKKEEVQNILGIMNCEMQSELVGTLEKSSQKIERSLFDLANLSSQYYNALKN